MSREERALLRELRPALVVGDLRLSLAISAPLEGVPHVALINAYWSPHAVRDGFPLPDHPIVRLLGERIAAKLLPDRAAQGVRPLRATGERAAPQARPARRSARCPKCCCTATPRCFRRARAGADPRTPRRTTITSGPVLWAPASPLPAWWAGARPDPPDGLRDAGLVGAHRSLADGAATRSVRWASRRWWRPPGAPRCRRAAPHVYVAELIPGDVAAARARAGRVQRGQQHRLPGAGGGATGGRDRQQPGPVPGDDRDREGRRGRAAAGRQPRRGQASWQRWKRSRGPGVQPAPPPTSRAASPSGIRALASRR